MRKIFKWIILIGLAGGIGWVAYKWYAVEGMSADAFSLIPSDAVYCLATGDPIGSWKEIAGSGAWTHLQKNAYFAELTASANSLDSLIHQNNLLFGLIGSRALLVSAHLTGIKKYDFLFLVDLKKAAGIKFMNEYLTTFSAAGLSVSKEKYNESDIIMLHNPSDKSDLYLSLPGTYLVASYSRQLVTAALDAQKGESSLAKGAFMKTGMDLEDAGILQLYVNYAMLPRFMACYADGPNEYINRLSLALQTSNLTMTLEKELIRASGHTQINDSVESYLKTLAISGKGPAEFAEIAPARTAFCLALGFTSFREFFENFQKNIRQDVVEYNTHRENLRQVESYLKISLDKNFIDWIGDEVVLLELQSSGDGLDNETALVLKADNIEKARKDLAYIEKMIRKKTPIKFKTVEHRGYAINYLSMKGLFKVLLGKFFARYDKPYYTIINNFVIFSNHPQTLESIIDDYLGKNTLTKSEEFRALRKEFDDEGSAFVYLNTPVLFNTLKKLADGPTRNAMVRNKEFIVCFKQIGFQLTPEEGGFKTLFAEQFAEPDAETPVLAELPTAIDSAHTADDPVPVSDSDPMTLPYIYVQNLNAPVYTSYYPDSAVHVKMDLKNGFKDGLFTEYYQNGEVKMRGHFDKDKRDGTWRLYDEGGKLTMKRDYEDNEIKKEKLKN